MNPSVLIADDEEDVRHLVSHHLRNAGFNVLEAPDGSAAVRIARSEAPALLVLDVHMPGLTGMEVCKTLKADPATAQLPIIMLTARAEEVDRILGLELGADDYLTKPFSPRELVLRIKSVLRRLAPAEVVKQLQIGPITIDPERHAVRVENKPIELTATEFKLLALLAQRRGRVQSRDLLLNDVWGYESSIDTRTVDTHVRRLREKLGPAADCIETVRGFGYRINE